MIFPGGFGGCEVALSARMKAVGRFLKATTLGGLFVLIPVVFICMALEEVLDLAIWVATPIADLFPQGVFDHPKFPGLIAIILILLVSFSCGILMLSIWAKRLGGWVERCALMPLPGYRAIKALTRSMGAADGTAFKPAMLQVCPGQKQFIYVIEDHGNGQLTILMPISPNSMAGTVRVIEGDQIEFIDGSLSEVSQVLSHWGVGASDLLAKGPSKDA